MVESKVCAEHSKLSGELEDLKNSNPLSGKTAMWLFGMFILISMAVVGFLWHGQTAIWGRVDAGHKETMGAITELDKKVIIIDYKVQKHLDESHASKK